MAMRHFFIGLGILAVALAVQPAAAQPEGAIVGDDDLPNGAPIWSTAAQPNNKPVCVQGPFHTTPQCRYNTLAECRADCRRKNSMREANGRGPVRTGKMRGTCFKNPALQQPARPASLKSIQPRPTIPHHASMSGTALTPVCPRST